MTLSADGLLDEPLPLWLEAPLLALSSLLLFDPDKELPPELLPGEPSDELRDDSLLQPNAEIAVIEQTAIPTTSSRRRKTLMRITLGHKGPCLFQA
jgi:hypothetical protein